MRSQPSLIRVLTPPPLGPSNLIQGATPAAINTAALTLHLAKAAPFAPLRVLPFKLHLITIHPNRPLVTYLIVPDGSDVKNSPKTVVVQHVHTKEIVFSVTLEELASLLFRYDNVSLDDRVQAKQTQFLKELGQVQRLDFFDPSSLYWRGHGTIPGAHEGGGLRWNYLLIQLQNRILLVNLRQKGISVAKANMMDRANAFMTVVADINQQSLNDQISSNGLPVSSDSILVGTADGTLKLLNWKSNVLVQSIRITNSKDPIVQIISTNKYETLGGYAEKTRRRVVCLTKKGTALLVEILVLEGTVHDITSPIARFVGGSVPSSMDTSDEEHSTMEHILVQYCAHRDLLLWNFPAKNAKGKLLVWNLGDIPDGDAKRISEPIFYEPLLVMQFPYESSYTIFPGWFHESIPMETMACAAVTKEGDFQIVVAPLYNSGSTTKNPYMAYPIFGTDLHQILFRDLDLADEQEIQMKIHNVLCPSLGDTSAFFFGTSLGVLMVKLVDGNLIQVPGGLLSYLSANFGVMGKAILTARGPEIIYANVESPGGPLMTNPVGKMEMKNTLSLYESPAPLHLPPEIHQRPIRLPPLFLLSPSLSYICCFWKEEMRYEVLHISTMLEKITSRTPAVKSPLVASGNGVSSFAWIGDDDAFSILYNPQDEMALKVGIDLSIEASGTRKLSDITKLKELKKLKGFTGGKKVKKGSKLQALRGLQETGKNAPKGMLGKGVSKMSKGTLKMTGKVTLAASKGTGMISKKAGGKIGFKAATFGFSIGKKKKTAKDEPSDSGFEDEDTIATQQTSLGVVDEFSLVGNKGSLADKKKAWVELRMLTNSSDGTDTISSTAIGELSLRSGNRNPPTILFGGPVLCVGCKSDENDEGLAYFYTKKKDATDEDATAYVSSGPAFPCPDLVVWDDDGRLCAVAIQSTVSIYISEEPDFIMLGTLKVGSLNDADIVISANFIHGTLYVATRTTVKVIFLGDFDGGVCHLDMYTLASTDVALLSSTASISDNESFSVRATAMPLNFPNVLGYQNGSLLISSITGVQAIPLSSLPLRIGALLGAGHPQKALKWVEAVPVMDHDALAQFLERRGVPEMALTLHGLSLEQHFDFAIKYGFPNHVEKLISDHGVKAIRSIDMGSGFSNDIFGQPGTPFLVCVSAYLLSCDRANTVSRLAKQCLEFGEQGKREAFMIATLLMAVNPGEGQKLISHAVQHADSSSDWPVGHHVRETLFNKSSRR